MNGKGDSPRNCFSPQFRENYDQINWHHAVKNTRTPDTYHAAVNSANQGAGAGTAGWDDRFRAALAVNGLKPVEKYDHPADPSYPGGFPYLAPRPLDDPSAWGHSAFIVWAFTATIGQRNPPL
jgi:hypothetical protein